MIKPFKRRWAEMAPFRESVLVHFTRPGLRQRLQNTCEQIAEEALELEEGTGFGESWLKTGSRAGVDDLLAYRSRVPRARRDAARFGGDGGRGIALPSPRNPGG